MQRSGFRYVGQNGVITDESGVPVDDVFGICAGGRAHMLAADTALTGFSINLHSFSVKAGQAYAVDVTGWLTVGTAGNLFVGINPFSASGTSRIALHGRINASNGMLGNVVSGTGFQATSLIITSTGAMYCRASALLIADVDTTMGITYGVTGGGVMTLLAGSRAQAWRIN